MPTGLIYIATNKTNGMCYVGQTTNTMARRKRCGYNKYFTNAQKKYEFDWVEIPVHVDMLDTIERLYIKTCNSVFPNGYNFELGGNGKKEVSAETRRKMSEASKGKKKPKRTPEHCKAIGDRQRGRKKSRSHCKALSRAHISYSYTITKPDGTVETTNNMRKYCKENGLTNSLMQYVAQGKYKQHKGYTVTRRAI